MRNGFTLIEVLSALVILAGFTALVTRMTYGNYQRLQKSQRMEKAAVLLERKMSEIEAEYKNQNIINLPEEDKGIFEEEKDFVWSYETRPLMIPKTLTLLALQKIPQNEINRKIAGLIREVLSETVVELKLKVTYQKGKRSVDYSLVSYFVNYEDAPEYIRQSISSLIPKGLSP